MGASIMPSLEGFTEFMFNQKELDMLARVASWQRRRCWVCQELRHLDDLDSRQGEEKRVYVCNKAKYPALKEGVGIGPEHEVICRDYYDEALERHSDEEWVKFDADDCHSHDSKRRKLMEEVSKTKSAHPDMLSEPLTTSLLDPECADNHAQIRHDDVKDIEDGVEEW